MKTTTLGVFLFLFTPFFSSGQSLPTRQRQYDFLKWYLSTDRPKKLTKTLQHFEGIRSDFSLSELNDLNDCPEMKWAKYQLTDTDIEFIKQQVLENNKVKQINVAAFDAIDWKTNIRPKLPITYISLPVFTCDGKTAMINKSFYCGDLCGHGGIEIFRKNDDGEWRHFKVMYWGYWDI